MRAGRLRMPASALCFLTSSCVSNPAADTGLCSCVTQPQDSSRILLLYVKGGNLDLLSRSAKQAFTVLQAGLCQSYQTLELEQENIWGKCKPWVLALTGSVMC